MVCLWKAAPVAVIAALCGASSTASAQPADLVNSTLWQQKSVEYRASVQQAYRLATAALEEAVRSCDRKTNRLSGCVPVAMEQLAESKTILSRKTPAVILDLDETVLDNSRYQGELSRSGDDFFGDTWTQWIVAAGQKDAEKAVGRLVLPGAAEFTRRAQALKVSVFYVSNRECPAGMVDPAKDCPQLRSTMALMERAGFARAMDPSAFMFATTGASTDKTARRERVASMNRYIAMLIGDDLGDFVGSKLRDQLRGDTSLVESKVLAHVDQQWGRRWIVIPNPTYGSWERFASAAAGAECATRPPAPDFETRRACRDDKALKKAASVAGYVSAASVAASGPTPSGLRIATWNLGWHVAQAELPAWIAACSKSFVKDTSPKKWKLAAPNAPGSKVGWDVSESRAVLEGVDLSVMPPCNTYQDFHKGIAVTPTAYQHRANLVSALLANTVKADIIAFQEVSGVKAVEEALGNSAAEYFVCSFEPKYKVQRLAFAWRKSLGPAVDTCQDIESLSLPGNREELRPRPALTVTLKIAGKSVRFMTVHLKSSCVSPLDKVPKILDIEPKPGMEGDDCVILQQQVAPLEAAWEKLGEGVDHFVVLGDFNRNLWHEANRVTGAEARRSDNSTDLQAPVGAGIRSRNLVAEVNDGKPMNSKATLLSAHCPGSSDVQSLCDASKSRVLTPEETNLVAAPSAFGCRNPLGLDHILVSDNLAARVVSVDKVSIGTFGGSRLPKPPRFPEPLLGVSDHCPTVLELKF